MCDCCLSQIDFHDTVQDMAWKKSPPELVDFFDDVASTFPSAQRRKMFGYPCIFVNGHLTAGLFQDSFILRLPESERTAFLKLRGAAPFEPMKGRPMKEYVVAPPALIGKLAGLLPWARKSAAYAASLPRKRRQSKAARTRA